MVRNFRATRRHDPADAQPEVASIQKSEEAILNPDDIAALGVAYREARELYGDLVSKRIGLQATIDRLEIDCLVEERRAGITN